MPLSEENIVHESDQFCTEIREKLVKDLARNSPAIVDKLMPGILEAFKAGQRVGRIEAAKIADGYAKKAEYNDRESDLGDEYIATRIADDIRAIK